MNMMKLHTNIQKKKMRKVLGAFRAKFEMGTTDEASNRHITVDSLTDLPENDEGKKKR